MFQKKSWLILAIVFGLMAIALFLPFERITAHVGNTSVFSVDSSLNGWELVSGSGVVSLRDKATAPVKHQIRMSRGRHPIRNAYACQANPTSAPKLPGTIGESPSPNPLPRKILMPS